jgi:CheY-like chemotaxis protein
VDELIDVLVVEDDGDVREALVFLLEDAGMHAIGATDGLDALERIEAGFEPSLILLDLMMPVMDGERFLRIRKSDPRLAQIPVIVVSAMQKMRVDPEDLRISEIIPKPVDPQRVIESVRLHAPAR